LHIEFANETQRALLSRQNRGGKARQSGHKQFVVCPQLKGATFTKMANMPDCCMCSQQFTIKCGVTSKGGHLQFKSAPPQLRNIADNQIDCGLKKVAELRLWTFKIQLLQFRNSLQSSANLAIC
jgi:hypothetical protein